MTNERSTWLRVVNQCASYLRQAKARKWLLAWMYGVAIIHLLIGIALSYFSDHTIVNAYHQQVLSFFWPDGIPPQAQTLQTWWMALFGATIQFLAILLGLLVYLGHRYRRPVIWLGIIISILIWAPQDMWVSWQAGVYSHIIIDLIAIVCFVVPLSFLIMIDRHQSRSTHNNLTDKPIS